MSTAIDTVTIGGIEDRRLQLANAQAARVIDIGTSWTKIRLGIRFALDDPGTNLGGTPRLCLGMLSNPNFPLTNGPLGVNTGHFIGYASKFAAWTRNAGPPVRFAGTSPCWAAAKKIGDTFTTADANVGGSLSGAPSTHRPMMIVDITKGAPNFTMRGVYQFTTLYDSTPAQLITAMGIADTAAMKTYLDAQFAVNAYVPTTDDVVAVDEATNGYLNAVCVSWDRTTPVVHISDFYWTKIS